MTGNFGLISSQCAAVHTVLLGIILYLHLSKWKENKPSILEVVAYGVGVATKHKH